TRKLGRYMSRRKKNRQQWRPQPPTPPAATAPSSPPGEAPTSAAQVEELSNAAAAQVTGEDLQAIDALLPPAPDVTLKVLIAKGQEALALLEVQRRRAQREEEEATAEKERAAEERSRLA